MSNVTQSERSDHWASHYTALVAGIPLVVVTQLRNLCFYNGVAKLQLPKALQFS